MLNVVPTLAAPGIADLLTALVPVVVFVIWVIGQIANRAKEAPAKPVRRPAARPAADWADEDEDDVEEFVMAQPAEAGGKKTVFDEIEQFLARARQQAQQAAQPQPPAAAKPIVVKPVVAQLAEPRRGLGGESPRAPGRLGTRDRVTAHVNETVDTSDITANIEQLGDSVEIADDVMEAHLKEVFDHRIGTLQQSAADTQATRRAAANAQKRATGESVTAPPVDFAAMLANTGDLRKAIVLNEILQRPAERW
jgi:hypothetical protein